jgi:hypothetical protein
MNSDWKIESSNGFDRPDLWGRPLGTNLCDTIRVVGQRTGIRRPVDKYQRCGLIQGGTRFAVHLPGFMVQAEKAQDAFTMMDVFLKWIQPT